jgi:hypothetical protein
VKVDVPDEIVGFSDGEADVLDGETGDPDALDGDAGSARVAEARTK